MSANLEAISSMPNVLTSRTMVRRFLGMASYYAHFVPHFVSVASPLHVLSSNTSSFQWHDECSNAVFTSKQLSSQAPVLQIFIPTLPTRITCDASLFKIGAVLEQQHENSWHPVYYLSRTFSKSERNYPVLDKEWLSIITPRLNGDTTCRSIPQPHCPQALSRSLDEQHPRLTRSEGSMAVSLPSIQLHSRTHSRQGQQRG